MEKSIKKFWPVFVLPTLAAFIIGFIWPFIWGIGLSFCKFTTVKNVEFVGLDNYFKLWQDDTFIHAFFFTTAFTIVATVAINVLGFTLALLLTRHVRGTNIFRTVYFMPNLIGGVVLGYIWNTLLNGVLTLLEKPLLQLNATYGFWGIVILCMPLGILLMLVFGFWFTCEISCQIVSGDLERVFHVEEQIRARKDAELAAALAAERAESDEPEEEADPAALSGVWPPRKGKTEDGTEK